MKHTSKLYLTLLSFAFVLFLTGCSDDKQTIAPPPEKKPKLADLLTLTAIQLVPEQKTTPSNAAIHQLQYTYEDKSIHFPSADAVLNEATVGNVSIVILDTRELDNNYTVLRYEYEEDKWMMKDLLPMNSLSNNNSSTDLSNLKLPFSTFSLGTSSGNFSESTTKDNEAMWTLVNKEKIVSIAKIPVSFIDQKNIQGKHTQVGQRDMFVSNEEKKKSVSYAEANYIVLISGNVSSDEMIQLASSLPSITLETFPRDK